MTLQLVGIHAQFDGRPLYQNLHLTVDTGEIVSLVGPSGSGKSTLLRIIAGIERPLNGRVILNERDITDLAIHRRGIGMVFQDNQLFPHLDVAKNIGYGLKVSRRSPSTSVERMLELIGLGGFASRRVDTLSGGEAKRVALARSLIVEPRVLLLDEPAAGVPEGEREEILEAVAALPKDVTVVLIEHDMDMVFRFAERLSVLVAGAVLTEGTVDEIKADPRVKAVYLGEGEP